MRASTRAHRRARIDSSASTCAHRLERIDVRASRDAPERTAWARRQGRPGGATDDDPVTAATGPDPARRCRPPGPSGGPARRRGRSGADSGAGASRSRRGARPTRGGRGARRARRGSARPRPAPWCGGPFGCVGRGGPPRAVRERGGAGEEVPYLHHVQCRARPQGQRMTACARFSERNAVKDCPAGRGPAAGPRRAPAPRGGTGSSAPSSAWPSGGSRPGRRGTPPPPRAAASTPRRRP